MNTKKVIPQVLFVGLTAFSVWAFLIYIVGFYHEVGHALIASIFGVQVVAISPEQVVTGAIENPSVLLTVRLAGGLFQAALPMLIFICIDLVSRRYFNLVKKHRVALLVAISLQLALLTHGITGVVNGVTEGFFPEAYSIVYSNLALWTSVFIFSAMVSSISLYKRRVAPFKDVWVFAYGSLIWNKSGIEPIDEKPGKLQGWHRDWTWISKTRHEAPTCSLQRGGKVKGVFLKLNPKTRETDLKILRKRERCSTEEVVENVSGIIGKIYFWTMGNNLDEYDDLKGLEGIALYNALAKRAKNISERGPDGKTAAEYAFLVYAFDPDDQITKMYTDEIGKLDKDKSWENPAQVMKVVNTRIESLKANRNFFTVLFTIESAILTVLLGYLKSLLPEFGISMLLLSGSLVVMLLGIFALTDSIHFYSKYIEYRYAWNEVVHGLAYTDQSSAQKAIGDFKRALEADDLGYYCLKLSLLIFLWFLASLIFVVPSESDFTSRTGVFVVVAVFLTLLAVLTYKCTHRKPLLKSFKEFFIRKPVFTDT